VKLILHESEAEGGAEAERGGFPISRRLMRVDPSAVVERSKEQITSRYVRPYVGICIRILFVTYNCAGLVAGRFKLCLISHSVR